MCVGLHKYLGVRILTVYICCHFYVLENMCSGILPHWQWLIQGEFLSLEGAVRGFHRLGLGSPQGW